MDRTWQVAVLVVLAVLAAPLSAAETSSPATLAVAPPAAKTAELPPKLTAPILQAWGGSPIILKGKLVQVVPGPVGLSEPPLYSHTLVFDVQAVLRGDLEGRKQITAHHSVQGDLPQFPEGEDCLVALSQGRNAGLTVGTVVQATPALLAEVKLACAIPLGWSVQGEDLLSPWAALGDQAWPAEARGSSPLVCAKTGRPALLAGEGVKFSVARVPPKTEIKWTNPDGDGLYEITVRNTTEKPITVPALLSDGHKILWNESLVILCQNKAYRVPAAVGVKGHVEPARLEPGQSVSTKINVLALTGPEWPQGGYRIEFTFCLGEKADTQSFYYVSRYHDALREQAREELKSAKPAAPAAPAAALKVELLGAHKETDRVQTAAEGDKVVLEVFSDSGIGQAEVARPAAGWPAALVIRLHLKGLEGFHVSNGRATHKDRLNRDGDPRRDPKTGAIDMTVPPALLDQGVAKLTFDWIDFYR